MANIYKLKLEKRRLSGKIRRERLREAKLKSNHTEKEWSDMLLFFDYTCARCLGDFGCSVIHKDHIIPIYQGGSHGLNNIQPLCAFCNLSKGNEIIDWRPQLADFLVKDIPDIYIQKEVVNG